jgi:hypothetical protein
VVVNNIKMSDCGCTNNELPIGPKGPQGEQGEQGIQGIQGIQGPIGLPGADGLDGEAGTPTSMALFGNTPNINGGIISGSQLTLQPADENFPGGVSITTQKFAGQKTFTVVPGEMIISNLGVGIGAVPNAHIFISTSNTFTTALSTNQSDIGYQVNTIFNYDSIIPISSSASSSFFSKIIGTNSPYVVYGSTSVISNQLNGNLIKSIGNRSGYLASGSNITSSSTNIDFLNTTFTNKTTNGIASTLTKQYNFYSSTPFVNEIDGVSSDFQIEDIFGYYVEDFRVSTVIPIVRNDSSTKPTSQINTSAWQFYAAGNNKINISSYIGNKIGIGFTSNPTLNSQIQALIHIGQGTADTPQIKLEVSATPTTPIDGQIWFESNSNTGLKMRINGVTKTITMS